MMEIPVTPKEVIAQLKEITDYQVMGGPFKDPYVAGFDLYPNIRWAVSTQEQYEKIEAELFDKTWERSGDGWEMYPWHDVSGYEYWMLKEHEPNYVQITILFTKEYLPDTEIKKIDDAFEEIWGHFHQYEEEGLIFPDEDPENFES